MVDHEETLTKGDISETLWRWGGGVLNDTYFWGLVNMHCWEDHNEVLCLAGSW